MAGSTTSEIFTLPLRTPPGVVGEIAERTKADVGARALGLPLAELIRRVEQMAETPEARPRGFKGALSSEGLSLIAEVKPRSPSGGSLREELDVDDLARTYESYASAISVLCDGPYFGGGFDLLERVRSQVTVPVMCKDFILSEYQVLEARAHGADAILLIAALLPPDSLSTLLERCRLLGMDALVETHDEQEVAEVVAAGAEIIGVNSRDLRTLDVNPDRARAMLRDLPPSLTRVAESGVSKPDQVAALAGIADAVLIGSALVTASEPANLIEELGWEKRT